jgi:uncharacterized Zn finger protein (UPF0148 family)
MKLLCPSCERLVELVDLRVERGALVVRCPACNSEQRQALPASSGPGLLARGPSPSVVDEEENDEGPTIILLTPGSGGGPLAIAPPGAAAPPTVPAAVARFEGSEPKKPLVIPPPPPPEAELPPQRNGKAVAAARTELDDAPRPRRVVDAEFAQLLTQLDDVHPPPRKGPAPVAPPPTPGVVRGSTVQIPPGHCPKCIAPRTREATLCPACGLVFANFRAEEHQPSAVLESAWHGLSERWEKPEEHEKFLQLAFNMDELARAGRLYRIKLAQNPDDAQAKTALEGMVRMASTAAALAARTDPADLARRRRKVLALSAMLFFVLPIAALLFNILLRSH